MEKPLILVTNDDGITAPGLRLLADALADLGEIHVFAPDRQQSGVGHGVSLHRPLRVEEVQEHWYSVDGTPADCVMLAVRELLPRRPDLVASGINPGPNLGDDVTYSGTVAGAYEGMLMGVPAFAISSAKNGPSHIDSAAKVAASLARWALAGNLGADTMLNLNVPDLPYDALQGVEFARMGRRDYQDEIITRKDPRGNHYYWIGGSEPSHLAEPDTDFAAIEAGKVSVTPLHRDLTHYQALKRYAAAPFAL